MTWGIARGVVGVPLEVCPIYSNKPPARRFESCQAL
jgi:hypothetical protein